MGLGVMPMSGVAVGVIDNRWEMGVPAKSVGIGVLSKTLSSGTGVRVGVGGTGVNVNVGGASVGATPVALGRNRILETITITTRTPTTPAMICHALPMGKDVGDTLLGGVIFRCGIFNAVTSSSASGV